MCVPVCDRVCVCASVCPGVRRRYEDVEGLDKVAAARALVHEVADVMVSNIDSVQIRMDLTTALDEKSSACAEVCL